MRADVLTRFYAKITKDEGGHWMWTGYVDPAGYARFRSPGELRAHRFSYTKFVGHIPADMVVDHVCRVRHCVNPEHLRLLTNDENLRAEGSLAAMKVRAAQTHCKWGHEFTEANTMRNSRNQRNCRVCHNQKNRDRRARESTTFTTTAS